MFFYWYECIIEKNQYDVYAMWESYGSYMFSELYEISYNSLLISCDMSYYVY